MNISVGYRPCVMMWHTGGETKRYNKRRRKDKQEKHRRKAEQGKYR